MHIVDLNEYLDSLTYQTFRIDASNSFHWLTEGPYFRISIVPNSLSNNHLHKNKCKIIQNFYWCSSFQILKTSIIYIKVSILVWRHPHQASSSLSSSSSCFTFFHRRPKKTKITEEGTSRKVNLSFLFILSSRYHKCHVSVLTILICRCCFVSSTCHIRWYVKESHKKTGYVWRLS